MTAAAVAASDPLTLAMATQALRKTLGLPDVSVAELRAGDTAGYWAEALEVARVRQELFVAVRKAMNMGRG